jgi:aminoglycoside phosphotransferase (APT) family kinase protein
MARGRWNGGPHTESLTHVDAEPLIARIVPGARVTDCRPLTGGVSAEVHTVIFQRPDGGTERVVVRNHRNFPGKPDRCDRAAREHALLTVLHAAGAPVPRPRLFAPPDTLVIDFVEGTTELPNDPEVQLADALAAIHATDPSGLPELPATEDPLPDLHTWLAQPDESGVDALVDPARLDAAAARCGPFAGPRRLLHGDYWPGNVMWHEGRLTAVLDWEDAAVGDPLSDLACARVELACVAGARVAERFTRHYLAITGADDARLALWDLFVSTAALQFMDEWGLEPAALAARRAATAQWQTRALAALDLN